MENMSLRHPTVVGRMMGKPLLIGLAGLMLSAGVSNAQTTGQGTFIGGAGAYSNGFSSGPVLQVGGAGEALIQNRFGIGGELGLAGGGGDAWATVSLNGSLHFPKQGTTNGVVPFVSGGYTPRKLSTVARSAKVDFNNAWLSIGASSTFSKAGKNLGATLTSQRQRRLREARTDGNRYAACASACRFSVHCR